MSANIFWKPDLKLIHHFFNKYVEDFNFSLGYSNWHYVDGFTKNCEYKSKEHQNDVLLMKQLEDAIFNFQTKYYKSYHIKEVKRIKLSSKPTIFLYWHQGKDNIPELQKLCYERLLQKCSNNFNILLLDYSSIKKYITIPNYIERAMKDKRMWLQHFVDYIRISLLAKYEAIWLDATIFVRDDLSKVNFNYDFWSVKCRDMYANTWAKGVIPQMNECQIYAMSGTSSYFYQCMKKLIEYHFKKFKVAYSYYMMYYIAQYLYYFNDKVKMQFNSLNYNNEDVECFANKRTLSIQEIENMWNSNTDTHLYKILRFKSKDDDAYKVYTFLKKVYEKDMEK